MIAVTPKSPIRGLADYTDHQKGFVAPKKVPWLRHWPSKPTDLPTFFDLTHGLRTTDEAFFSLKSRTFGLGHLWYFWPNYVCMYQHPQ